MTTRQIKKKRATTRRTPDRGSDIVRIVAISRVYGKLCRDSLRRVSREGRKRLNLLAFDSWQDVELAQERAQEIETVFVSSLGEIPERVPREAQTGSSGRHLLFAESLPVEAIASRLVSLGVKSAQRLHIARKETSQEITELLFRVFAGTVEDDSSKRIADAWIEDGRLVLLAPTFRRIAVPLELLEKYIGHDIEEVRNFEIDEDGSFLFWPHADVHLGWEQLVALVDPREILRAKQNTDAFNATYGAAIRAMREENDLRQSDIKGLTERNLRRIEKGELRASKNALEALAAAHNLNVGEYMDAIAKRLK